MLAHLLSAQTSELTQMGRHHTTLTLVLVWASATLHAQNNFQIDIDSTTGGPISTEAGFTSLDGTTGNGNSVVVDGTTFTVFSADGSRNRGALHALTGDFVFDDGAGAAVGLTVDSLPSGIYRASVYAHDEDFPAGDQIVGITRFGAGPETLYTESFASNGTDPFSFVFSTENVPDGSGIFARENNGVDRARFNGLELTQLQLTPSSTQFNIDSTEGGQPLRTESGFTSLDGTGGNGSSVVVDGVTFEVFSAGGSRNRSSEPSDLTADFVFDDGVGQAVGLTVSGLPDGIWEAQVYSFDSDFAAGDQIVGITQFAAGPELIFTDSFASNANDPFTFVFDSSSLPDGFGIFTRESNDVDRSRLNGLQLTMLQPVPEPASLAAWFALGLVGAAVRWRRP